MANDAIPPNRPITRGVTAAAARATAPPVADSSETEPTTATGTLPTEHRQRTFLVRQQPAVSTTHHQVLLT